MHLKVQGPEIALSWHFPGSESALFGELKDGAVPVDPLPQPRPWKRASGRVEALDESTPVDGVVTLRPAGFVAQVGNRRIEHTWKGFTSVALVRDGEQVGAWVTQTITSKAWGPTAFKKHAFPFFWADEPVPSQHVAGYLWGVPQARCQQSLSLHEHTLTWRDARKAEVFQKMPFRDRVALVGHAGKAMEYSQALKTAGEPGNVRFTTGEWLTGLTADRILDYRMKKGRSVVLVDCVVPAARWPEVLAHLTKCRVSSVDVFLPSGGDGLDALAHSAAELPLKLHLKTATDADLDRLTPRSWAAVEVEIPDGLDLAEWLGRGLDADRLRLGPHLSEGPALKTSADVLARLLAMGPVERETLQVGASDLEVLGTLTQHLKVDVLKVSGKALGDAALPSLEALLPAVRRSLVVRNQHLTATAIARLEASGLSIDAGPPWEDPDALPADPVPVGVPLSCLQTAAIAAWLREAGPLLERRLADAGLSTSETDAAIARLSSAAVFRPIGSDSTGDALALVHATGSAGEPIRSRIQAFWKALQQISVDHQFHNWDALIDIPPGDRGMSHWHAIEDEAYATDLHRAGRELSAAILHLADPPDREALRRRLEAEASERTG